MHLINQYNENSTIIVCFYKVLSKWMVNNPNVINTGNEIADSVITVLLSTSILLGGIIGCLLDNLIPGIYKSKPTYLTYTLT